jgi:hypothetical protein
LVITLAAIGDLPLAGQLEGVVYLGRAERRGVVSDIQCYRSYTFAVPDEQELAQLLRNRRENGDANTALVSA